MSIHLRTRDHNSAITGVSVFVSTIKEPRLTVRENHGDAEIQLGNFGTDCDLYLSHEQLDTLAKAIDNYRKSRAVAQINCNAPEAETVEA